MEITTNSIKNSILYYTGKSAEKANIEDLNNIKNIVINGLSINGTYNKVEFDEIGLFENLEGIHVENTQIFKSDFLNLIKKNSLNSLQFRNCEFMEKLTLKDINNIKKLGIYNCTNFDYRLVEMFKNLNEISLAGNIDTMAFLTNMNLEKVNLNLAKVLDPNSVKCINTKNIVISKEIYEKNIVFWNNYPGNVTVKETNGVITKNNLENVNSRNYSGGNDERI